MFGYLIYTLSGLAVYENKWLISSYGLGISFHYRKVYSDIRRNIYHSNY